MKIKEICDALRSISLTKDETEMVQICLGGLAQKYRPIQTTICMREKPLSFFDLQSMLLVEENHIVASASMHANNKMLYMLSRGQICNYRKVISESST